MKNNEELIRYTQSLNFLTTKPIIKFSTYNDYANIHFILTTTISNISTNALFYYSFDNINWTNFNDNPFKFTFFTNENFYIKVIDNGETSYNKFIVHIPDAITFNYNTNLIDILKNNIENIQSVSVIFKKYI